MTKELTKRSNLPQLYSNVVQLKPVDALKLTTKQAAEGTQLSAFKKLPGGANNCVEFVAKGLLHVSQLARCEASGDALVLWAELIAAKYWYFKAEEILKAFIEGASGKYGQIYGQVDYTVVCSWLDRYHSDYMLPSAETEALRHKEGYDHNRESLKSNRDPLTIKDLKDVAKLNTRSKN